MAYNKVSPYRTVIGAENGWNYVQYHATRIVSWNDQNIILRSGGYETVTTKRKMNQASHQFGLGYGVYQKAFDWFVTLPDGRELPFTDGMVIGRQALQTLPEGVTALSLDDPAALHSAIAEAVGR